MQMDEVCRTQGRAGGVANSLSRSATEKTHARRTRATCRRCPASRTPSRTLPSYTWWTSPRRAARLLCCTTLALCLTPAARASLASPYAGAGFQHHVRALRPLQSDVLLPEQGASTNTYSGAWAAHPRSPMRCAAPACRPPHTVMEVGADGCGPGSHAHAQHIMIDLGTGNNNKINWAFSEKQELIDIIEVVYRRVICTVNRVREANRCADMHAALALPTTATEAGARAAAWWCPPRTTRLSTATRCRVGEGEGGLRALPRECLTITPPRARDAVRLRCLSCSSGGDAAFQGCSPAPPAAAARDWRGWRPQ